MTQLAVEAGGVELAVDDRGAGQAVVLVHGTAAGRTIWRETVEALGDGVRTIAYDRRAYGDSGAPEPYGGTTVGEQADDLAALIRSLGAAPAVLCGHELGALACLDVLLRHRDVARAAVLLEPPMLWLVSTGPDAVSALRSAVEAGARGGGAAGAVDAYIEEVEGPDAPALLGHERVDAARQAARAFAADLGAAASWPAGRRELRAIAAPVTVVTGTRTAPVRHEAARRLAGLLPAGTLVELPTGHLSQVEAPADIAAAISNAAA